MESEVGEAKGDIGLEVGLTESNMDVDREESTSVAPPTVAGSTTITRVLTSKNSILVNPRQVNKVFVFFLALKKIMCLLHVSLFSEREPSVEVY